MNFTHYTLGEALSSTNETIKRNAFSILKQLQKERDKEIKKLIKETPTGQDAILCNCGRNAGFHHVDQNCIDGMK